MRVEVRTVREPLQLLLLGRRSRRPRGKHRSPLVGDDSRRACRDGACHHAIEQPPPDKMLPRTQRVCKQCLAIVPPLPEPRECKQTNATAAATKQRRRATALKQRRDVKRAFHGARRRRRARRRRSTVRSHRCCYECYCRPRRRGHFWRGARHGASSHTPLRQRQ